MKMIFFKTPKPKTFNYRPLFYDQRKEELEKIRQTVKAESGAPDAERVRVQLQRSWQNRRDRQRRGQSSTIKLLIYLALLIFVVYFIFFAKIF